MTQIAPAPRPALDAIEGSLIREVSIAGREIPGLIRLFFGEPDTVTPAFIREAAKAALDAGETFYAPTPASRRCARRSRATWCATGGRWPRTASRLRLRASMR